MTRTVPTRFVRQFALTAGRARSLGRDLPLDTIVVSVPPGGHPRDLCAEERAIVALCSRPLAMAELSAHLHLHLGIVRVLVSDLCDAGLLDVATVARSQHGPDLATLERLLDDLHAL